MSRKSRGVRVFVLAEPARQQELFARLRKARVGPSPIESADAVVVGVPRPRAAARLARLAQVRAVVLSTRHEWSAIAPHLPSRAVVCDPSANVALLLTSDNEWSAARRRTEEAAEAAVLEALAGGAASLLDVAERLEVGLPQVASLLVTARRRHGGGTITQTIRRWLERPRPLRKDAAGMESAPTSSSRSLGA